MLFASNFKMTAADVRIRCWQVRGFLIQFQIVWIIIHWSTHHDLIRFPIRDAADNFRSRFIKLHRKTNKSFTIASLRTLHSFIINSTKHLKSGGNCNRLVIDEALMLHAGEILFAAVLSGMSEVILIGGVNKIPYINRTNSFEVRYYDIRKIASLTQTLNLTFRCTRKTTALLSKFYE